MTATIEELQVQMRGIVDKADAESRNLTDDEMSEYEDIEKELKRAQRSLGIQDRQRAYQTPVAGPTPARVRDAQDAEYEMRAFDAFLRTGVPNDDLIYQDRAQSEGTNTQGGYLVPTTFLQQLVEVQKSYGGLAPFAQQLPTATGEPITFPSLDDTAHSAAIATEGSAPGSGGADLVFGQVSLGSFEYAASGTGNAPIKVPTRLLEDSAFDIQSLLSRVLGIRLARAEAQDFITGAGSTSGPDGILISTLTADVKQGTSGTFTYADMCALEDALDPVYQQDAQWVMNLNSWSKIRQLVDSAGRPLIIENAQSGISGPAAKSLLGYPVVIDQGCPSAADDTPFAILGDLDAAYIIRRIGSVVIGVNPYSSMSTRQIEYNAWERIDGTVQNRKAYVAWAGKDSA